MKLGHGLVQVTRQPRDRLDTDRLRRDQRHHPTHRPRTQPAEKASRFLDLVLKCFKRDGIEEAEPTGQEQMGFDFR